MGEKGLRRMLHRNRIGVIAFFLSVGLAIVHASSLAARQVEPSSSTEKPALTVDEIVNRMEQRNRERAKALRKFKGTRVYRMQYHGFLGSRQAEMTVKLDYTAPDDKVFTVISESGTKFIIDHVFNALIEGEKEATSAENQRRTALSAENYSFTFAGLEDNRNPTEYVLDVIPKTDNKFLYRGRAWIDAKDFAVTRVEAELAKSPSFWIKKSEIRHRYEKIGDFWLPVENRTESSIRLGGHALLSIEYKDYSITDVALCECIQNSRDGGANSVSEARAVRTEQSECVPHRPYQAECMKRNLSVTLETSGPGVERQSRTEAGFLPTWRSGASFLGPATRARVPRSMGLPCEQRRKSLAIQSGWSHRPRMST
jgi:hypothetical protein